VRRRFDQRRGLEPLDLRVSPAETLCVIGPSGSGKSTLLRLMLGLLAPDAGTLRFRGEQMTPAAAPRLRREMGYVTQSGGLFPHLTATQNVLLLARHLRRERAWCAQRLQQLRELVRLPAAALERFPGELSGGERQRVSLMRALMLDPTVLLLDEPLGALDPMTRFELQEELRRIFSALARTVVLVTHDLSEAAFFADQVLLMKDGVEVARGPPQEVFERSTAPFVQQFVHAQRGYVLSHERAP
jgi:osmoprotectant transport system ATP-binding protein